MFQTYEALSDLFLTITFDRDSPWWDRCTRCRVTRLEHSMLGHDFQTERYRIDVSTPVS